MCKVSTHRRMLRAKSAPRNIRQKLIAAAALGSMSILANTAKADTVAYGTNFAIAHGSSGVPGSTPIRATTQTQTWLPAFDPDLGTFGGYTLTASWTASFDWVSQADSRDYSTIPDPTFDPGNYVIVYAGFGDMTGRTDYGDNDVYYDDNYYDRVVLGPTVQLYGSEGEASVTPANAGYQGTMQAKGTIQVPHWVHTDLIGYDNFPQYYDEITGIFSGLVQVEYTYTPSTTGWDASGSGPGSGSGGWLDPANWNTTVPDAACAVAHFGQAQSGGATVTINSPITVGTLVVDSTSPYTFSGTGSLTFECSTNGGKVLVPRGNHTIDVPVAFASDTQFDVAGTLNLSDVFVIEDGRSVSVGGGGTLNANGDTYVGTSNGAGSLLLQSGTLNSATTYIADGDDGAFVQTGGTHMLASGYYPTGLHVGESSGGVGTYDLEGGSISAGYIGIGVGSSSEGHFTQLAATSVEATSLHIGGNAVGTYSQSGGTVTTEDLVLGYWAAADGTYTLSGGTLAISDGGIAKIGREGNGTFIQTGGSVTASSDGFPEGIYVGGAAEMGSGGGTGSYQQSGGTLSTGYLGLGVDPVSSGEYVVSDTAQASIGQLHVGGFADGNVEQTGGTVTADDLTLGYWSTASGTYALSGGSLTTNSLTVGRSGSATFTQLGGTHHVTGSAVIAMNSGSSATYTLSGGTLQVDDGLTVESGGTFEFQGGTLTADVTNNGTFNVRGGGTRSVNGDFVNNGTLKTYSTAFAYTGTFTNNGSYISDPADNFFSDLIVSSTGSLVGGVGDRFIVSGKLLSSSTQAIAWNTAHADLLFQGSDSHTMSITGADLGANAAGFDDNFAWGSLSLASGESLAFVDGNGEAGGALYLGEFLLADGLAQLPLLQATDVNIYYDPSLSGFLNGAAYQLIGGGWLRPVGFDPLATQSFTVMPEPSALSLALVGTGFLGRRRRRN